MICVGEIGWTPKQYWSATPRDTALAIWGYRYAKHREQKDMMLWDREKLWILISPHVKKEASREWFCREIMPFPWERDAQGRPKVGRDPEKAKATKAWLARKRSPDLSGKEITVDRMLSDAHKRKLEREAMNNGSK